MLPFMNAFRRVPLSPSLSKFVTIPRRGYAQAVQKNEKLLLSLALPYRTVYDKFPVNQVDLPTEDGEMGILKDHVPMVQCLRPGVVSITDESSAVSKYFVSGGFAVQQPSNELSVTAPEAFKLEEFSSSVVSELLDKYRADAASSDEKVAAEASVRVGVLEALSSALK
ncbi:F1-ATPase delta subunit [Schizosaccharomyces cryophilus OY26]|uniref:ATP synthase subunit delta, mitochondrial n=1 Tax=Schizosaccharomyces cryophilus (strain OY26 / ATCC MYA-4695 / CBS 11777 / NBRC 106824 / NRRL Y48691) TaxID=653667 RepID=S9W879_SCHCR|nr:F1-ATPase delta subunit [Schizosaccharomyces cryophilus OY26]EPY53965.1 F1-ATPase delta subunit [Schizosaccharomyces cryophilus OY26]